MSQPSVASFFTSRKRAATEEIRNKAKVLCLDNNESLSASVQENLDQKVVVIPKKSDIVKKAVRNLQFDASPKSSRPSTRSRIRTQRGQDEANTDIRESFSKLVAKQEDKVVVFEKKGALSPRKAIPDIMAQEKTLDASKEMNLTEIKQKILKSSRLAELRDRIDKFKKADDKLQKLEASEAARKDLKPNKQFESIQFEIASPKKVAQSPCKSFMSPTKRIELSTASPQRKLLMSPKEVPASPIKGSPTKIPAYQRFQAESDAKGLPLPYDYRFLAEIFRSVDTIAGMFFNRKETITYNKLKPAVQELLRRNFTVDHLAKIKTIYPGAFEFRQEKLKDFGSFKQEQYELVLVPTFENNSEKKNETMGPGVLLERRRTFFNTLLNLVKDQHNTFLLNLDPPMHIPKEKINRWHPEFEVNKCKEIEKAELPQPPTEKVVSANEVLQRAKNLFEPNSRLVKAAEILANAKDEVVTNVTNSVPMCTSVVDTPPATPTTSFVSSAFKGIPSSLLEKVRAKQAAKAMEAMTRTPNATKEAAKYARLPELSKVIRNIFVSEKKSVMTIEAVITKLRDSYRSSLTCKDLEEHIRLLAKLLPVWASVHNVRKVDYLKIAKDIDMSKIIKRLEIMADQKL